MKLLEAIQQWRAKREALGYDPRLERRQIAEAIATALVAQGYQVKGFQYSVDGPLGGESSRVRVTQTLVDGSTQDFDIQVYARGVFSEDNERVRAMLGGT